jgi:hypothetical protein
MTPNRDHRSPAPTLFGHNRETVVAEKLRGLVRLRMFNPRMDDYDDLWLLTASQS